MVGGDRLESDRERAMTLLMKRSAAVCLVLSAALVLAACGRAGAPLTPYESAVEEAKENETAPPPPPERDPPFVLDKLLQ